MRVPLRIRPCSLFFLLPCTTELAVPFRRHGGTAARDGTAAWNGSAAWDGAAAWCVCLPCSPSTQLKTSLSRWPPCRERRPPAFFLPCKTHNWSCCRYGRAAAGHGAAPWNGPRGASGHVNNEDASSTLLPFVPHATRNKNGHPIRKLDAELSAYVWGARSAPPFASHACRRHAPRRGQCRMTERRRK